MFGPNRIFVINPGGGYAPAMGFSEKWTGLSFDETKATLMGRMDFWCTEDTQSRGFWHYRPRSDTDREVFGTIELNHSELVLDTTSKPRFLHLRAVLEEVLGPLPSGRRQVSALVQPSEGAELEVEQLLLEDDHTGDSPVLVEYAALRARFRAIHAAAVKELLRDEILEAARQLHLLNRSGVLAFESKDEADLLMDFALYEVRRHGRPVITHFMRKNPPADDETSLLYRALEDNWVSLFRVERVTPVGLLMHDMLTEDGPEYRLVDNGLIHTAAPGLGLVVRLLRMPRFVMTSGFGFAVRAEQIDQLLHDHRHIWLTESNRASMGVFIRHCRKTCSSLAMVNRSVPE